MLNVRRARLGGVSVVLCFMVASAALAGQPLAFRDQATARESAGPLAGPAPMAGPDGACGTRGTPLSRFLRPDGTLSLPPEGIPGSIDPAGFRLASGPGEVPRFQEAGEAKAAEATGDQCWDTRFHPRGMSAPIHALVSDGTNLYAGGNFTSAGGVAANFVAKWDGASWSALGTGTNYTVNALAWDGTNLYAGGGFTLAGGVAVSHIAKWDGTAWSPLGTGLNSTVYALAWDGTNLYAGGGFTVAGDVAANSIAKWNGMAWSALGAGTNAEVAALVWDGTSLCAGGIFSLAGGVAANHVAKWDGTTWSALGAGTNNAVFALAGDGTNLYAGGSFSKAGGADANSIAKWDGSAWRSLGAGTDYSVYALAWDGANLYAGGAFYSAGGAAARGIAKWNGASWSALGVGMGEVNYHPPTVLTLAWDGTNLYAGGDFTLVGGVSAYYLGRWNGTVWTSVPNAGGGMDNHVYALAWDGSNLYAGGYFTLAGDVVANFIAKWDGTTWRALGAGTNYTVYALAWDGTNLYAGGTFNMVGGATANSIAKWSGTAWSALGTGMENGAYGSYVGALAWDGANLYAGGVFTTAGGVTANNIAKWDGTTWSALGTGMDYSVHALAWDGTNLYAGGSFTIAGGVAANHVAKWDGTAWSALGTGTDSVVFALAWSGTNLYAGGGFHNAGETAANYIAQWNGSTWSALGSGKSSGVYALAWDGSSLYAGGDYTGPDAPVNYLAKWDGTDWSVLGTGMNGEQIYALAWDGTDLYAGGDFTIAGNTVSSHIARWLGPSISAHPANSSVCEGNSTTFAVAATGTELTYQWQVNTGSGWTDITSGVPYSGATTATLGVALATAEMNGYQYRCLATGCDATAISNAAMLTVITSGCAPSLGYDSSFNPAAMLVQICGDGDNVVEPGEEWQVTVRLVNAGNQDATNVAASLAVNAGSPVTATILGNPASFGTVVNGGGTSTATYRFVVSPGAACVHNLTFDVSSITSSEGSYPSQLSAFSTPVGISSTQNESAGQQTSPLNASGGSATSDLGPAFTLASATTATLSYSHAYVPPSSTATLFSDEFAAAPGSNGWTVTGSVSAAATAPTDTCTGGGGSYARLDGANPSVARVISTSGRTNVTLTLDHRYVSMGPGQGIVVEYSTSGINGPWTTQWSKLSSVLGQSTSWTGDCGRTVTFPSSCENNPNFALRIRSIGGGFSSVMVDHLKVTADAPQSADWATSAKVELVDPSGTATALKAYGSPDGSPYNIQPFYTGPGTYKIRLHESAGGTATVTSASLFASRTVVQCDVSSCAGASGPPPVGNGKTDTTAATFTKSASDPQQVDVTYDATHCTGERAVVLYGTIGNYSGYTGCAQSNAGNTGTATVDTTGLDNVWFNIVWANGTTAGNPGTGYNGTSDIPRTWSAAGRCGIVLDDSSNVSCAP